MTGEKDLFTSLELHDIPKETIVFGENSKGDVIGFGKIALSNNNSILNIYLVETLGTTCCRSRNFVRWATSVSLLMRV
jgi:hypothetical protein